ncbi:MAG: hypothetical protein ABI433_01065 [Burkholderiaceae bacterium]
MAFVDAPDVYLRDFGVPCVAAARNFLGIFDRPDDVMNMGGVNIVSTMYALTVKTSDVVAAAILTGSAITVNGTAYVVRDSLAQDDGLFTVLTLSF